MTRSALLRALVLEATTRADAPLVPARDELLRLLGPKVRILPGVYSVSPLCERATAFPTCYRAVTVRQPPARKLASNQSTGQPPRRTSPHRRQSWDSRSPRSTRQSFSAPIRPRSCAAHHRDGGSARFRRSRGDPRQRRGPGEFEFGGREQVRTRGAGSGSSRPARASTAVPTRAPAACPRSLSSRPARASTVAPTRARAACGRTTSPPARGPAISRLPPMAPRLAPVARPCSRRVLALARPQVGHPVARHGPSTLRRARRRSRTRSNR